VTEGSNQVRITVEENVLMLSIHTKDFRKQIMGINLDPATVLVVVSEHYSNSQTNLTAFQGNKPGLR
jgi:hypothetical protein